MISTNMVCCCRVSQMLRSEKAPPTTLVAGGWFGDLKAHLGCKRPSGLLPFPQEVLASQVTAVPSADLRMSISGRNMAAARKASVSAPHREGWHLQATLALLQGELRAFQGACLPVIVSSLYVRVGPWGFGLHTVNCSFHPHGELSLADVETIFQVGATLAPHMLVTGHT